MLCIDLPPRKVKPTHVENIVENNDVDNDEEAKEVAGDAVASLVHDETEPDNTDTEGLEDFIIQPTTKNSEKCKGFIKRLGL